jgi:hypothetical protein
MHTKTLAFLEYRWEMAVQNCEPKSYIDYLAGEILVEELNKFASELEAKHYKRMQRKVITEWDAPSWYNLFDEED